MPFLVFVLFVVALLVAGFGIKSGFSESNEKQQVTSQKVAASSRSALNGMLRRIETKEVPERKMGAMCYEMAALPEYGEYVCPLDGSKSVYDNSDYKVRGLIDKIDDMRRTVARLNSLTDLARFALDEKRLCHACSPGLGADERYVSLSVTYPDGKQHTAQKVDIEDLWILAAFFENKLSYTSFQDAQVPLKDKLGRIKELLGTEDAAGDPKRSMSALRQAAPPSHFCRRQPFWK
jgi:hypothetical protein